MSLVQSPLSVSARETRPKSISSPLGDHRTRVLERRRSRVFAVELESPSWRALGGECTSLPESNLVTKKVIYLRFFLYLLPRDMRMFSVSRYLFSVVPCKGIPHRQGICTLDRSRRLCHTTLALQLASCRWTQALPQWSGREWSPLRLASASLALFHGICFMLHSLLAPLG